MKLGKNTLKTIKDLIKTNKVVFIVGSNGIGKSTFCKEFSKCSDYEYYNPMVIQEQQKSELLHGKLKGLNTGISIGDTLLQLKSSDGENYFGKLFSWLESHKGSVILDEADKGFSMQLQWNYMHLISDEVNKGRKIVVITHSYICIRLALEMGVNVYDFDTGGLFTISMLPPI